MMLISSFDVLIAVVSGVVAAALYKSRYREHNEDWYLGATLVVIVALWANFAAENFVGFGYWSLGVPVVQSPIALGISYILVYPLWFRAAGELTFVLIGRHSDQGGVLWVFRLRDRTEPISPSWMSPEVAEQPSQEASRDDEHKQE